jgi:hypothetical protein
MNLILEGGGGCCEARWGERSLGGGRSARRCVERAGICVQAEEGQLLGPESLALEAGEGVLGP